MIQDIKELPQIIGISGYKGSGKTTIGDMIGRATRLPVKHIADPIKRIVEKIDPYDSAGILLSTHLEIGGEAKAKRDHDTYRHTLRELGEGVRSVLPAVWLSALAQDTQGMRAIVVPDVRLPIEAEACAVLINVTRPGVESDGHDTERNMQGYATHHLRNDGDMNDLAVKVQAIVNDLELEPNEY